MGDMDGEALYYRHRFKGKMKTCNGKRISFND